MNATELLAMYEQVADAPDAIAKLRSFVLDLAVRGRLVEQHAGDEPANELLKRIAFERTRLIESKQMKSEGVYSPLDKDAAPFALPAGWAWTRLGALINLVSGQHLQPGEYADAVGNGLPYITGPSDFGTDGLRITKTALVRKAVAKRGQLLLTVKGSGVGKSVTCDVEEVAISRQLMALTAILFDSNYLSLVMHLVARSLRGSARSLIPGIAREDVETFVVALPPLTEQHRIVAKVDELMALCDQLDAARTEREAARDRLAAASLARLNAPDADTFQSDAHFALNMLPALSARADQVKQLRQTILNLAMRGKLSLRGHCWDSPRSLGEVATLQNGYAFKSEWFAREGVRLLRNVNVSHGELSWKDDVCLPSDRSEEYSRFLLREGDVVLSLDRPFIASGTKAARVRARDLPALLLQRVGRFQPTEALLADFLYLWLVSPHFSEQVDPGRSNGVPHISSRQVEAALIFVPPIAEQQRIVAVVKELTAICDQLEASLANGEGARSRLLEAVLHRAIYSDSASVAVATTAFAMSKVRPQLKAKATRA